jgi:predicted transcriptional regulator of viral defense system
MRKPIARQIRQRIHKAGRGSVFLVRDFLDIGSHDTITRTLARLMQEGLIRRLQRGVYDYPRVSALVEKPVPPDPAQVAAALARRTGGEIIPSQAQAANLLGLTTQVPAKNVFQTNGGKTRRVKVGNQTIELRRVSARRFSGSRRDKAEAIIQGLQFVGEGNVTSAIIAKLRGDLSERQKTALRAHMADAPAWMHPALRLIAQKDDAPL